MTQGEAKRILELCRPADLQSGDTQILQALEVVQHDAELRDWFEQHLRVEEAVREKFRSTPVPEHLKQRLLEQNKIVRPGPAWGAAQWLQLAACLAVLIAGVAALTHYRYREAAFSEFESRMVRSALRDYKMEIVTQDMGQLRRWMQSRRAPADFTVPKALSTLKLTGGGVLRWHNHPVSMTCFDRGDKQMLFLFVMEKDALNDPPSSTPQLDKVKKLATASWSQGDKTYLLAGPGDKDLLGSYLGAAQTL